MTDTKLTRERVEELKAWVACGKRNEEGLARSASISRIQEDHRERAKKWSDLLAILRDYQEQQGAKAGDTVAAGQRAVSSDGEKATGLGCAPQVGAIQYPREASPGMGSVGDHPSSENLEAQRHGIPGSLSPDDERAIAQLAEAITLLLHRMMNTIGGGQDSISSLSKSALSYLRRRLAGTEVTRERLELEALLTERAGMDAENAWRARRGEASAYGMDHYNEIADRIRSLGIVVEEKNGGAE